MTENAVSGELSIDRQCHSVHFFFFTVEMTKCLRKRAANLKIMRMLGARIQQGT